MSFKALSPDDDDILNAMESAFKDSVEYNENEVVDMRATMANFIKTLEKANFKLYRKITTK